MFNPEQTEAVKTARLAMEAAMRELWRLEHETILTAEADLKKAEEAYQRAASAAVQDRSARTKLVEAEGLRDDARRNLDGLRQLAKEAKQKGQWLGDVYSGARQSARQEEAMRLLGEAKRSFGNVAARWNEFAAAVRELVLIKKALAELGDEGATQFRFVAEQLDRAASGRFCLETMVGWELAEDED
jgi:tetratricopeptide (TPR) repeat protein